jgi:hypothetical protein
LVSRGLLFPCPSAGAARNSAITKLVQFDHLSNVSVALADNRIDYDRLLELCEATKIAADSMTNKRRKREGDSEYHGVVDLQMALNRVCPFVLEFLQLRNDALEDLKKGLSIYGSQAQSEKVNDWWSKQPEFYVGMTEFIMKKWATKINHDASLIDTSKHTLEVLKPKADELYAKLGEGRELFEKIGHYFVLNRHLQRASSWNIPEQRIREFYERLGGKRNEVEGYIGAIKKLQLPALELAIDDYLLQFRQARRLLKAPLAVYGTDKVTSIYPSFNPSIEATKERLTQEFEVHEEKIPLLARSLRSEVERNKDLLSKVQDLVGTKINWL